MKLVLQLVAVAVVSLLGGQGIAAVQGSPWLMLAVGVATAVIVVLVYAGMVRLTENRAVVEVTRRSAVTGLGVGTLLGVALFGLVITNIAFLGYYRVTGTGSAMTAVGLVGYMAGAAATEEVLFRGVLFRIIERRTGTWLAMLISGLLFGAYHLMNPDASILGALAVAVEAGGMLTAAYVATRRLWVPIGLHFGWNFAEAGIFSTVVSGNGGNHAILDAVLSGPALVTGGDFGPEGSAYSVVCCVLTAIVFLVVARRRGTIRPPRGRRAVPLEPAATLPQ